MNAMWQDYIDINRTRFLDELASLLRIPSISTDPAYKDPIRSCARRVKKLLLEAGCTHAAVLPTGLHPVVYGERMTWNDRPTILIYGHYDVQPVEPTGDWEHDPFEPVFEDGKVFARGASDNKGQFFAQVKAFETACQLGLLRVNVKFLIEGEEETGSPSLKAFLHDNRELLQSDIVLISDSDMIDRQTPVLEVGFRGNSMLEVEVTGANRDLHSGSYGGAVPNPILILSGMLASLHDADNHVTIPGFYRDVKVWSAREIAMQNAVPYSDDDMQSDTGLKSLWGEKGYTTWERIGMRPTIEINGFHGGYGGEGMKSVIPASASAKISARLVPYQSSVHITRHITEHLQRNAPSNVDVNIKTYPGSEPYETDTGHPAFKAIATALKNVYGKDPIQMLNGGSLPLCYLIEKELGVKSFLMGFGLPDDNIHAPNEKFEIAQFYKGIHAILQFYELFGA